MNHHFSIAPSKHGNTMNSSLMIVAPKVYIKTVVKSHIVLRKRSNRTVNFERIAETNNSTAIATIGRIKKTCILDWKSKDRALPNIHALVSASSIAEHAPTKVELHDRPKGSCKDAHKVFHWRLLFPVDSDNWWDNGSVHLRHGKQLLMILRESPWASWSY